MLEDLYYFVNWLRVLGNGDLVLPLLSPVSTPLLSIYFKGLLNQHSELALYQFGDYSELTSISWVLMFLSDVTHCPVLFKKNFFWL